METFYIVLHRMVIFFLILLLGAFCGRKKIIAEEYLPNLQQLITKIFLPVLIFCGTYIGATWQDVVDNAAIITFAAVFYVVVGLILFGVAKLMRLEGDYDKGFTFCFLFGNTLFVGIPLLTALFPERGMLYIALFGIIDQLGLSHELMVAMVVLMSLPVMTVVPMIARANGNCGEYAAGVTAVTLAAAVVTVPVVQLLAFL